MLPSRESARTLTDDNENIIIMDLMRKSKLFTGCWEGRREVSRTERSWSSVKFFFFWGGANEELFETFKGRVKGRGRSRRI